MYVGVLFISSTMVMINFASTKNKEPENKHFFFLKIDMLITKSQVCQLFLSAVWQSAM